jgi:hypothetical protein
MKRYSFLSGFTYVTMDLFLGASSHPTNGIYVCPIEPDLVAMERDAAVFHPHL